MHATSGYTGGVTKDPTYGAVCGGSTGHAEAVQVIFDPKKVSYGELVKSYLLKFRPQRYDANSTSQYRAAIFYQDEEQKKIALKVIKELKLGNGSENLLEKGKKFYAAEEYHQDYYNKMTLQHH